MYLMYLLYLIVIFLIHKSVVRAPLEEGSGDGAGGGGKVVVMKTTRRIIRLQAWIFKIFYEISFVTHLVRPPIF